MAMNLWRSRVITFTVVGALSQACSKDEPTVVAPAPPPSPITPPPGAPTLPPLPGGVPPVAGPITPMCTTLGDRVVTRDQGFEVYAAIDAAAYPQHVITGVGGRVQDNDLKGLVIRTKALQLNGSLSATGSVDVVVGDLGPNALGEVFVELPPDFILVGFGMSPDSGGDDLAYLSLRGVRLGVNGVVNGSVVCGKAKDQPLICQSQLFPPPDLLNNYDEFPGVAGAPITGLGARVTDEEMNGFKVETSIFRVRNCQ